MRGRPRGCESIVHRVERVPDWQPSDQRPKWRSLCGTRVGETTRGGSFEFEVPIALELGTLP